MTFAELETNQHFIFDTDKYIYKKGEGINYTDLKGGLYQVGYLDVKVNTYGLTRADFADAIQIQDACNLSGVVHSFSRAVSKVWEQARLEGKSADWVNSHPICIMYASKIASLTQCENTSVFSEAYDKCVNYNV